jgi:hypothetical protein
MSIFIYLNLSPFDKIGFTDCDFPRSDREGITVGNLKCRANLLIIKILWQTHSINQHYTFCELEYLISY